MQMWSATPIGLHCYAPSLPATLSTYGWPVQQHDTRRNRLSYHKTMMQHQAGAHLKRNRPTQTVANGCRRSTLIEFIRGLFLFKASESSLILSATCLAYTTYVPWYLSVQALPGTVLLTPTLYTVFFLPPFFPFLHFIPVWLSARIAAVLFCPMSG
ncbi:uncharacterized protein LY79DRAFT_19892 [Colletotrichum navitas]|uniref:Uncharacterized protein n=1 Tax=Colletotrichum navitas TaxID=681940 RepID=A0AAD8QD69_9PEZI|nr:uncharacterized protein LY79DRAFT_19892 [Colletotrichum navitas]KAK1600457.1 hypothetical protein LY79DRAFT_19892 [Colletotrichum navitas]